MRWLLTLAIAALSLSAAAQKDLAPDPVTSTHSSWKYQHRIEHLDTVHGNFIKLNLSRLLFLDIALSYERKITKKISLEAEAGYQVAIESHTLSPEGVLIFEPLLFLPGQGFSFEAGPKFYRLSRNNPGFYLLPWAVFKTMWCTNVAFPGSADPNGQDDRYPNGNNHYQVYGAIMRVGTMKRFGGVVLDLYAGAGLKVRVNHYELFSY